MLKLEGVNNSHKGRLEEYWEGILVAEHKNEDLEYIGTILQLLGALLKGVHTNYLPK